MQALFGKTYQVLASMLDYRAARQKVITSNVANIDTSDYKPKDLKFPEQLKSAMGKEQTGLVRTDPRHLSAGGAGTGVDNYTVTETSEKTNIDTEMMNISENNLMYNLTVELLARKFRGIQNVLRETK